MDLGIFDSGLGGFSVLAPFLRSFHQVDVHYLMDNRYLPYGEKSVGFLRDRARDLAEFFNEKNCRYLILACNTITALAYDVFLEVFQGQTYGIIEYGVRSIQNRTSKGLVGILATQATVASGAYEQKLKDLAPELGCRQQAAPRLVPYIEGQDKSEEETRDLLAEVVDPLVQAGVGQVLLACTHYPWLMEDLQRLYPNLAFINPADYLVQVLEDQLEDEGGAGYHLYMTQARSDLLKRAPQPPGRKLEVELVDL